MISISKTTTVIVKLAEEIVKLFFGLILYANDTMMNCEFLFLS